MYQLYLVVATIDVIKLQVAMIEQQVTHRNRIVLAEVLVFSQHDTLHSDIEAFAGGISDHGSLLVEMSQLTGIVGHTNLEPVVLIRFGIFYLGTATVWIDLFNSYFSAALNTKFKDGSDWLLVASTPHINDGLLGYQFLSVGSQYRQQ